ncbi:MAG: hypothetical protein ACI9EW_000716 [Cellvibrionaceae bacterium]|jgi:hypothetical protein
MKDDKIVQAVKRWLDAFVVGMNLCPFAKRELAQNRVRFAVTRVKTVEHLLLALQVECQRLNQNPSIETTILIHPNVLSDFYDYNQFLGYADLLLEQMGLEGVYQIASFHPDYQFAGTEAENYSNRSPYPLLHLLREDSVAKAIDGYPDVDQIPIRNMQLMNQLGVDELKRLLRVCVDSE